MWIESSNEYIKMHMKSRTQSVSLYFADLCILLCAQSQRHDGKESKTLPYSEPKRLTDSSIRATAAGRHCDSSHHFSFSTSSLESNYFYVHRSSQSEDCFCCVQDNILTHLLFDCSLIVQLIPVFSIPLM